MTISIKTLRELEQDVRNRIKKAEDDLELLEVELNEVCSAIKLIERLEAKPHLNGTMTATNYVLELLRREDRPLTAVELRNLMGGKISTRNVSAYLDKLKKRGVVEHSYDTHTWRAK